MRLSDIFEFINSVSDSHLHANMWGIYTWCWEVGNYAFLNERHSTNVCFYSFCLEEEARDIVSVSYEQGRARYSLILRQRMLRGPVVIPVLVVGKLNRDMVNYMLKRWRLLGARYILYHKAKTRKFYLTSLRR